MQRMRSSPVSSPLSWLAGPLMWLALLPSVGAQEVRRAPAPRVDAGLFLERDRDSDGLPRLEPIDGGRLKHSDPRFTAIINSDGSVEFRDVVLKPEATILGFDLLSRKRTPPKPLARDNFEERALYPHGPPTAATFASVGGGFASQLIGLLVRKIRRKASGLGDDHGRVNSPAKKRFLAQTEALRTRMAHAWLKARLAEQQVRIVEEALALWRDPGLPLVERKRRIFVLWDECSEPGELRTPADEIQALAAREARGRIEALLRMLAPRGSPQQFTPAELELFNRGRESRARFDPYAGP